jgi:hypothetical protein
MHTLVQRAKNKEVWRLASDTDIADCLGETNEALDSENPAYGIWEALSEVSWLSTLNCVHTRKKIQSKWSKILQIIWRRYVRISIQKE